MNPPLPFAAPELPPALGALLELCVARGASDLHLVPDSAPVLRLDGELVADEQEAWSAARVFELCDALFEHSGRAAFDRTGSQDGALSAPDGTRFRFNVFRRLGGVALALRQLEDRFRTLGELGLPEHLYRLCDHPDGLVVVAGPTGAGKSTTLAALVDHINRERRAHVITLEDPIEYVHRPARCLINQRQVGSDVVSFDQGLVAALREDPDVILVGEMRDVDTMRAALRAAETGHLVLTTVHAGDTVGAIERLVSVFPAEEQLGLRRQLSLVLRAVIAQRLLPTDGRRQRQPGPDRRARVVASEVLLRTPAVANLVASGRSAQLASAIEGSGQQGMHTFEQDLARLVSEGWLSEATALAQARSGEEVLARLGQSAAQGRGGRA
jgi:twitching motility protein PilT